MKKNLPWVLGCFIVALSVSGAHASYRELARHMKDCAPFETLVDARGGQPGVAPKPGQDKIRMVIKGPAQGGCSVEMIPQMQPLPGQPQVNMSMQCVFQKDAVAFMTREDVLTAAETGKPNPGIEREGQQFVKRDCTVAGLEQMQQMMMEQMRKAMENMPPELMQQMQQLQQEQVGR